MRKIIAAGFLLGLFVAAPAITAEPQPLMSAEWLNGHRAEQNLVVLDIRSAIDGSTPESFAQGHIPGAVHSDYDKGGWRVERRGMPLMVPTVPELEKLIEDSAHGRTLPQFTRTGKSKHESEAD